jgi:hypothetical protein
VSGEPVKSERARRARERVGGENFVDMRDESGKRGYSWPPFEKGNLWQLRHGATVPRIVDPIAEELVEGLLERRPDLERFPEALAAWGRAESRCLLLAAWFGDRGLLDGKGQPTASAQLLNQSERLASEMRGRLGLDPKSESELAQSQAQAAASVVDLEAIRAQGRKALERHREAGRLAAEGGRQGDGDAEG